MLRRLSGNILIPYVFLFISLVIAGCGGKRIPSITPSVPLKKGLPPIGYTIQVGAFSNIANAVRLSESLEKQGLDAYYFRHQSGLFKVRFGNFASRNQAETIADKYVALGYIESYYIVAPEDYALAEKRFYGSEALRMDIVRTAESFIGLPYKWGGNSPEAGFDCSGLSMAVYHLNGLNLPRTSKEQYDTGVSIERKGISEGDLVFFKTTNGRDISHVGIYTGQGKFIHAPGTGKDIRIDSLLNTYYAAKYAGAKSYIE
jgi:hypothetical protein